MKSLWKFAIAVMAAVSILTACDKSPVAKFKTGDKVTTLMGAEGVVWRRTRFFVEDIYYIRVPLTDAEKASYRDFPGQMPEYHLSGPYDPADLRLVAK
jgi:hypothetical protein